MFFFFPKLLNPLAPPPSVRLPLACARQALSRWCGFGASLEYTFAIFALPFPQPPLFRSLRVSAAEQSLLAIRAWMVSSELGAAGREPPPADQLASFYKLVDKKVIAGVLKRHARCAELSALASTQAEALFTDDSLVVAHLRVCESDNVAALASESSHAEEGARLRRRAWDVLLSVIRLLMRRLKAGTLLPGTIREVEIDFFAHEQAAARRAQRLPAPPSDVLRALVSPSEYNTLLLAMHRSHDSLIRPVWEQHERMKVELFVLQGLDVIPRITGVPACWVPFECHLVAYIEEDLSPQLHGPVFCSAVLRKWRSAAVSSVLQARGVLQTGVADAEQIIAGFDALQREDIAKHGLRDCALPSCSKTETTVKEFALCFGCRSVVCCCAEHQGLDWTMHNKACQHEAQEAARLDAEEGGGDATGAGSAAA